MLKAYLAHSSIDKSYVRTVSKRIGRSITILDEMAFPPGFDFRDTIRNSLDKSSVFIFFASKTSIESTWVKFEIDEAEIVFWGTCPSCSSTPNNQKGENA